MVDLLTWTRSQQHCNSCWNEAYLTRMFFSIRYTTAFLCLVIIDSTSAMHGDHFNSEVTNIEHKHANTWHQIDCKKDTCLQHESWNKKAEYHLGQPQLATCMLGDSHFSQLCACLQRPAKTPWVLGLHTNFSE